MRFLPAALAVFCSLVCALPAADTPTVETAVPDLLVSQGSGTTPIDLRNYFKITSITGQVVQFRTNLGTYNLEMLSTAAPNTVTNFLRYVNDGKYTNTIFHRSNKITTNTSNNLDIVQGGGFAVPATFAAQTHIATYSPIALEYNLPNTVGTIAMARTSSLNSATSEWFINLRDNTTTLGQANNGGYAVFGRVTGTGMTVVSAILALPIYTASGVYGSAFGELPLTGYTGGEPVAANFVTVNAAEVIPLFPTQAGQTAVVAFTVTANTNSTVATATVSGSTLNITPNQPGVTSITVRATDTNGNITEDTFRLKVGTPEIAVEQPVDTALPDGGARVFPLVHVGDTSDMVFTVKNLGNVELDLTGTPRVTIDGTDAAQFSVVAQPSSPVAASGSTTFTVRFTPTGSGVKTARLHLASDDSDESIYDIDVTGTGNFRPTLTLPNSPIVVEAAGPNGAVVNFTVSANDAEDGPRTPELSKESGELFAVGDTTVLVSATDTNAGKTDGTFVVRVRDTKPPQIGGTFAPLSLASDRTGKVLLPDYTGQATTSDVVGVASVTQSPAAGTLLSDGNTLITLTAHDAAGNTADTSFTVTVTPGTRSLLSKDGDVPGAGIDPKIPAGAKWGAFGLPSLTKNGSDIWAGWLATVKTSPTASFAAIFSGPLDGTPVLRLKKGESATDATGTALDRVSFASFRTPVFAGGEFAVPATVAGKGVVSLVNDTGLWVSAGGTLRGIARAGTPAPGVSPAKFLAITSVAMPSADAVFFTATLSGAGTKNSGLWRWTNLSGTQLVFRKGSIIDVGGGNMTIASIKALTSVPGSPGHGRYDASAPSIDVLLGFTNGSTAIGQVAPDGTLQVTQRSSVLDGAGRTILALGIPSSPGAAQDPTAIVIFKPDPALTVTTANNRIVYDFATAATLAQTGLGAPGASPAKFFSFLSPAAGFGAASERVTVFGATLKGSTTTRDTGLWTHNPTDGLTLLAREGSPPPGASAAKWLSFPSASVLDGRGPIFTAKLMPSTSVTTANNFGFWATDSTGTLRLLIRTGDKINGKKLKAFSLLGAVAGSPGQLRNWTGGDPSPRVIYRATFIDGSTSIVSTLVP